MERRIAISILLLILVFGGLFRIAPVRTGHHYWDETVYLQHGEIIAGDRPADTYNEFDIRPPLISLLVGAVFALGGSVTTLHILLAVIATVGIGLTYLLGTILYDRWVGLISAAVYAVSPVHVYFSHFISVDPLLPVLWTGAVLAWLRGRHRDDLRWAVIAGILCGLAALAKFTSLVLPAALIAAAVLLRLNRPVTFAGVRAAVLTSVRDVGMWALAGATGAVFAPYLLWQWYAFGSPFHVFRTALAVSNAQRPFLTYLWGAHELVPYALLGGLVLFVFRSKRWQDEGVLVPSLVFLALVVPLQFAVVNKEVRYLLPVLGVLAVMVGAGFEQLRQIGTRPATAIMVVLVLAATYPVLEQDFGQMVRDGRHTFADGPTEVRQAADWLAANTPENTTVYTNDGWPVIAYYSGRIVRTVPGENAVVWPAVTSVSPPGYIVYRDGGAWWAGPPGYLLQYNPRYIHEASFGEVSVYRIGGS